MDNSNIVLERLRELEAVNVWVINEMKSEIMKLPLHELMTIFNQLPLHIRTDDEILNMLPCTEHFNQQHHQDHIDGPFPSRSKCHVCIKSRNN